MKVFIAIVFAIGYVSAKGSGPYLPSGWRPQGPSFYLPSEVTKPADSPLKENLLQETEASGSDALREYGPPKLDVVEVSVNQALPDVATEQTFFVQSLATQELVSSVQETAAVEANIEQVAAIAEEITATTEAQLAEKLGEETTNTLSEAQPIFEATPVNIVAEVIEQISEEAGTTEAVQEKQEGIVPVAIQEVVPAVSVQEDVVVPTSEVQEEIVVPTTVSEESGVVFPTAIVQVSEVVVPTALVENAEVVPTGLVEASEAVVPTASVENSEAVVPTASVEASEADVPTASVEDSEAVVPTALAEGSEAVVPTASVEATEVVVPTALVEAEVAVPIEQEVVVSSAVAQEETIVPTAAFEQVIVEKVAEGVDNIAEALVNLEKEVKAAEALETAVEIKQEISGSLEQAPEGFLEYGPPGFTEYGPPKQEELARSEAVEVSSASAFENNEVRRRRFSPKFKSHKKH